MYVLTTYCQLNHLWLSAPLLAAAADEKNQSIVNMAVEAAQRDLVNKAAAAGILDKVRDFAARNNNPQIVSVIDCFAPSA